MCDDRLDTCSTCQEESCTCHEVCEKCNGWAATCKCVTEPVRAHNCKDCGETGEAKLDVGRVDGKSVVFYVCSACGSENVKPVDEAIDAAEYSKGER